MDEGLDEGGIYEFRLRDGCGRNGGWKVGDGLGMDELRIWDGGKMSAGRTRDEGWIEPKRMNMDGT